MQTLTSKGPINWRRTLAIAAFGFVWAGPSAHYWQAWLQKTFPKKDDKTLIKKVPGFAATSCLTFADARSLVMYLSAVAIALIIALAISIIWCNHCYLFTGRRGSAHIWQVIPLQ